MVSYFTKWIRCVKEQSEGYAVKEVRVWKRISEASQCSTVRQHPNHPPEQHGSEHKLTYR